MSELEEMVETARRSLNLLPNSVTDQMMRTAILAVFEKHLKAMVEHAFFDGGQDATFNGAVRPDKSVEYAERVISELKT